MVREWTLSLENTGGRQGLRDPLGYKQDIQNVQIRSAENATTTEMEVYENKAWEFAKSPLGQLPMFMFIFWMTGSSLSIYTIMFTVSFAMKPFTAIAGVNAAFENYENKGISLIMPKLIYIASNAVTIAMAAYKFSNMGIIPVLPVDWAGLFTPRTLI